MAKFIIAKVIYDPAWELDLENSTFAQAKDKFVNFLSLRKEEGEFLLIDNTSNSIVNIDVKKQPEYIVTEKSTKILKKGK